MSIFERSVYAALTLVALAVAFQLCWRYEYVRGVGRYGDILRVDRLTGRMCIVPCTTPPWWERSKP